MSKISFAMCLICFFVVFACTNTQKNLNQDNTYAVNSLRVETPPTLYPAPLDTVSFEMLYTSETKRIDKKANQNIYLKFPSLDYTRMNGKITLLDSLSNIRFSQIILPDGTMDGPFGNEMSYHLPIKGEYVLILHENMMAGDPWEGTFDVTLTISK
ncbi:MAG: hypothetical protein LUH22_13310 [Bacteroides sp.]|nr:hypothetical protein [Bacteroides sp.]